MHNAHQAGGLAALVSRQEPGRALPPVPLCSLFLQRSGFSRRMCKLSWPCNGPPGSRPPACRRLPPPRGTAACAPYSSSAPHFLCPQMAPPGGASLTIGQYSTTVLQR